MVRKRTSPGEEFIVEPPLTVHTTPDQEEAAAIAAKGPFLEYLSGLNPAECEQREVWIYRGQPAPPKGGVRKSRRLEVRPLPVNAEGYCNLEDYVQETYGGGDFECHVKLNGNGRRPDDHNGWLYLDGPTKYSSPTDPVTLRGETGQPVVQAAAPLPSQDAIVNRLLDRLDRPPAADDVMTAAAKKVVEKSLDTFASAASKEVGSMTGNPALDKLVTSAIERMVNPPTPAAPPAAVDPVQQTISMLELTERLRAHIAPAPAEPTSKPERPSLLHGLPLKEVLEAARGDNADLIRELVLGPKDEPTLTGVLANFGLNVIERNPDLPGKVLTSLLDLFDRIGRPAGTQPEPLRLGEASAPVPPTTQPSQPVTGQSMASAQTAPGAPPQAVIDDMLSIVRRAFEDGNSGAEVAISLKCLYPRLVRDENPHETPTLLDLFDNFDDQAILSLLRSQLTIEPILSDARFPVFYAELRDTILGMFPHDEDDSEDEAEQVATDEVKA